MIRVSLTISRNTDDRLIVGSLRVDRSWIFHAFMKNSKLRKMHVKFYRIFKIKYVHVILSSG